VLGGQMNVIMKLALVVLPLMLVVGAIVFTGFRNVSPSTALSIANQSFYDLSINRIDEGVINMADYKGKYVLCVNVASKCGYTPQYKDLQKLSEKYADRLVVIGFPCNQFMGQESGTNTEIITFCEKNYGVTFSLTEKINVKGKSQHPVYQWLCNQPLGDEKSHEVKWNFHKFLLGLDGKLIGSFASGTNPMSPEIVSLIQE
jgi:glutathione peroxidase